VPNLYRGSVCVRQYCLGWRVYATYIASLSLELVEAHAILHEPDESMRFDVVCKGKRVGVADPASRELQGCITESGFLKVSPYCT
jgi:hypothetical protein